MINHVSIGVRDMSRAKRFYGAALKPLGYKLLSEGDSYLGYGVDAVDWWVTLAERPVAADMKSGLHFCFSAPTRKSVTDYGPNYYAAYVVDPDGYRLEAYCDRQS